MDWTDTQLALLDRLEHLRLELERQGWDVTIRTREVLGTFTIDVIILERKP